MTLSIVLEPATNRLCKYVFGALLLFLINIGESKAQSTILDNFSYPFQEKLIQIAKENYPRVKAFDTRIELQKTNLTRVKLNWFDIISFSFIYNPNYTFNVLNPSYFQGIQVGVSLNVASTLQKPYNVKTARLETELARYDRDEYLLNLETLVSARYIAYLQAVKIAQIQSTAYNNSEDVLKNVRSRFERSEATYDVYNQALISNGSAAQSKLTAEASLLIAKRSLEELLGGRKLEEIK